MTEMKWKYIGIEYPPFDVPVLVTDGKIYQVRTLKKDKKLKYWVHDHEKDFRADYWMPFPFLILK